MENKQAFHFQVGKLRFHLNDGNLNVSYLIYIFIYQFIFHLLIELIKFSIQILVA